jgi:CHAD domain-containing protein/CYTH domain-containing protein
MATDLRPLLIEPTPRAARAVALVLLDALDAEHARLDKPNDVEALHDFRVALRRLRSWLRAYRRDVRDSVGKKAVRTLSGLAAVTTDSRDIEVHLEWLAAQTETLKPADRAGVKWLATRLTTEKTRADAALREGLASGYAELSARLRKNLARYAVAVWDQDGGERWAVTAAAQVQDAFLTLRRRLAAIDDRNDDEREHRARIAGKRLRYLLEPLANVIKDVPESVELLKTVQDLIGSMHDAHVFTRLVRRHARAQAPGTPRSRRGTDPRRGLRTLASRLAARRDESWQQFTQQWMEHDFAALSIYVHAIIRELREVGGEGIEIERKYLLRKLPPEVKHAPVAEIEQGYLPGKTLIERLRRVKTSDSVTYLRTVKLGSGLVRTEIEETATPAVFKSMWPLTKGKRLRKRRFRLADAGHVWEIDEFLDRKLVLAEIELISARDDVAIPDWLARCLVREVTGEIEYLNHTMAR